MALLGTCASSELIKTHSTAAFHEWARLISNGDTGVNMGQMPKEAAELRTAMSLRLAGVNPQYRPKGTAKADKVVMLRVPDQREGGVQLQPAPAAAASSSLTVYSQAGPAIGFALPPSRS